MLPSLYIKKVGCRLGYGAECGLRGGSGYIRSVGGITVKMAPLHTVIDEGVHRIKSVGGITVQTGCSYTSLLAQSIHLREKNIAGPTERPKSVSFFGS